MQDGQFVVEDIEDYDVYRWREGLYCFHEKPLADIMKDLEKYFDLEIRLENPHLAGIVLTGKFRIPEGLDYILRVLQLDVNFTYRRDVEQNIHTLHQLTILSNHLKQPGIMRKPT